MSQWCSQNEHRWHWCFFCVTVLWSGVFMRHRVRCRRWSCAWMKYRTWPSCALILHHNWFTSVSAIISSHTPTTICTLTTGGSLHHVSLSLSLSLSLSVCLSVCLLELSSWQGCCVVHFISICVVSCRRPTVVCVADWLSDWLNLWLVFLPLFWAVHVFHTVPMLVSRYIACMPKGHI